MQATKRRNQVAAGVVRFGRLVLERPRRHVDGTVPYPGMANAIEVDRTVRTPPPEHVLAAAAANDALAPARAPARAKAGKPLNSVLVNAYKTIGFAILTVILLGLVSYIATNLFYFVSSSWLTPTVIAPTAERVLALNTRLAEQSTQRDRLAAERALIAANLADADRIIAMDEKFEESFRRAVSADAAERKRELGKLRALVQDYEDAKRDIGESNRAFADMSRERNDEMKQANLIDKDEYLTGNYQLSQIASSNLQLAEKAVELDARASELSREADALDATASNLGADVLSYDVLRIRQELQRATLELAKAKDTRRALDESLRAADKGIARYDRMLKSLEESPLLRAAEGKVTLALVPYDNLPSVKKGAKLYSCAVGFIFCRKVGTVAEVLPGEMEVRHPIHATKQLRGQAVRLELTVPRAAEETVLFAGRPLYLL